MNARTVSVPGLTGAESATVGRLLGVLSDRSVGNARRDRLYEGREAVQLLGASIPAQYTRAAHIIGWPAKAVDALARRCVLVEMVDASEGDDLGLRQLARENELRSELAGAVTSMLLHGVAFLVSSRGDKSINEPAGLIHVVSAHDGTGDWNPRSRRLDSFLSVHARNTPTKSPSAFTLYLPEETISASIEDGKWRVIRYKGTGEVPVEPLRYQQRPDRRPFGRSRITRPVAGLTRAAMRVAIRMEGHGDIYSVPQLLVLGATAEDLTKPGGGSAIGNALGALYGIPDDPQAAPGTERAQVTQISSDTPTAHIQQLRQLAQLFSGETSIPVSSLGISDMANPSSADSYLASREDLITEADGVLDGITGAVERAVARSLAYRHGETTAPEEWDIMARWRPVAHLSHASQADAGVKMLGALPWLAETALGPELVGMSESQQRRAADLLTKAQAGDLIDRLLDQPPAPTADTAVEDAAGGAQ